MSFFNKVLASVGIGAAKVDTKLVQDTVTPGGEIKGVVEIRGGNVEQKIDAIYLSIHTTYLKESDDKKYTVTGLVDRFQITASFNLRANERKEIPFSFILPLDTPQVWILKMLLILQIKIIFELYRTTLWIPYFKQ